MIEFTDKDLEVLYTTQQRKGKYKNLNTIILKKFVAVCFRMASYERETDFRQIPSWNYKRLDNGYSSVRLNDQYRLIIRVTAENNIIIDSIKIDEISKHYE